MRGLGFFDGQGGRDFKGRVRAPRLQEEWVLLFFGLKGSKVFHLLRRVLDCRVRL